MKNRLHAVLLLAAAIAVTTGCKADPPATPVLDANLVDAPIILDAFAGCPSPPTLAAPVITPPPNPTFNAQQPIRGTAVGADTITATGGAGNAAPVRVNADGKFCIEVRLIEDAQNTLTLIPIDKDGCQGNTSQVVLTHRTQNRADAGASSAITNVAKGAPITSKHKPDDGGSLSALNDGDAQSWAKFSFRDLELSGACDTATWMRIDLGKVYTVSKVKIVWAPAAGSDYATCYTVLVSSKQTPGEPDPASPDWIVVSQTKQGDANDQVLAINPENARWAAVLMYENASSGLSETFRVAEIEVWGQDPNAIPPPPQERCD